MPVFAPPLQSQKNRVLPVDGDGQLQVKDQTQNDLLEAMLAELTTIRLILAEAFETDIEPEDVEE